MNACLITGACRALREEKLNDICKAGRGGYQIRHDVANKRTILCRTSEPDFLEKYPDFASVLPFVTDTPLPDDFPNHLRTTARTYNGVINLSAKSVETLEKTQRALKSAITDCSHPMAPTYAVKRDLYKYTSYLISELGYRGMIPGFELVSVDVVRGILDLEICEPFDAGINVIEQFANMRKFLMDLKIPYEGITKLMYRSAIGGESICFKRQVLRINIDDLMALTLSVAGLIGMDLNFIAQLRVSPRSRGGVNLSMTRGPSF